ncbi:hypothetical protein ACAN107058_12720 [Paracidovorax anthurii]
MLVWKAMESMTPMMSPILREDAVMSSMVRTTLPTTSPPRAAVAEAEEASWDAVRTVSAFCLTVEFISSMEAAVCWRLEACSSVRWLRSALPVAIWEAPVAMDSLLWRTSETTCARLARMAPMAARTLEESPERRSTRTARLPRATSWAMWAA